MKKNKISECPKYCWNTFTIVHINEYMEVYKYIIFILNLNDSRSNFLKYHNEENIVRNSLKLLT